MTPQISATEKLAFTSRLNAAFSYALFGSSIIDYFATGSFLTPGNDTPDARAPRPPVRDSTKEIFLNKIKVYFWTLQHLLLELFDTDRSQIFVTDRNQILSLTGVRFLFLTGVRFLSLTWVRF